MNSITLHLLKVVWMHCSSTVNNESLPVIGKKLNLLIGDVYLYFVSRFLFSCQGCEWFCCVACAVRYRVERSAIVDGISMAICICCSVDLVP